ncbi:MAG: 50S ribosomal protein L18 [Kiritimatiellia bacterium]|nr:50S ribosomal protein L18 [Kiritimatiellia bacterium]
MKPTTKQEYRARRHLRLRKRIQGTAARPRLSVFVSNRHLYVQFVDDDAGKTLAAVSTRAGAAKTPGSLSVGKAKDLGTAAAQAAQAVGIETVVFDRGGFAYAGRIQALAEAARAAGLRF